MQKLELATNFIFSFLTSECESSIKKPVMITEPHSGHDGKPKQDLETRMASVWVKNIVMNGDFTKKFL